MSDAASKACRTCKVDKPLADYNRMRSAPDGLQYTCRDCEKARWKRMDKTTRGKYKARDRERYPDRHKEYRTKRYAENPDAYREAQMRTLYGIGVAQYDEMLTEQKGVCAVCLEPSDKTLHVDHDHATGRIRGLLCQRCNHGIGSMKDDPVRMLRAVRYLGADLDAHVCCSHAD